VVNTISEQAWEAANRMRALAGEQLWHRDGRVEDLYETGGALTQLCYATAQLAETLARQASSLGDGLILRDDAGEDPDTRLAAAAAHLRQLHTALETAGTHASGYHQEMSHIGVEVDPSARPEQA
jgi:hypothetical protein